MKKIANAAEFDQILANSAKPVLVKFEADWCQPCLMMQPIVAAVALKFAARVDTYAFDIDSDKTGEVSKRFKILSIPSLIVFKNGKEKQRVVGTTGEADIRRMLSRVASSKKKRKV